MYIRNLILAAAMAAAPTALALGQQGKIVTETTPSYAQYFSWINNTNEGATEAQTLINLDFFRWLNERYGMQLDIYAFDAGAVDGAKMYGSTRSERFKHQFPNGFGPISEKAAAMGIALGLWGGPDGFGDTPQEAEERIDMMKSLVRDNNFRLFKMDAVCGQLRPDKYGYFDRMMTDIRQTAPEVILLNHRLQLGPGDHHSTTHLLGGMETYIDVFMNNTMTAPHHRAQAISRMPDDGLGRLNEDHGVCLSSCLDGWDDDLILQAFNRGLIISPQIYANPWLLSDDEFPYLAYIYNLHRDYRDILIDGIQLPDEKYGPGAVSRGDGKTQFLTLRNLTWNPVTYRIKLDSEVGLTGKNRQKVRARLQHPYILDMGEHRYGDEIEVEVLPFRAALLKVTTAKEKEKVSLSGIPYRIINDRTGNTTEMKMLGNPGETYHVVINNNGAQTHRDVTFTGTSAAPRHFKVAQMEECPVPDDVSSIYYATCFAADNNALEVRSLQRSGPTEIEAVQNARDAFFNQPIFVKREIWDRNLFDGDPSTAFSVAMRCGDQRENGSSGFYLDLGEPTELDSLVIRSFDEYSITPLKSEEGVKAYVSADLHSWKEITFLAGTDMNIPLADAGQVRYLRFAPCPIRLSEVEGFRNGKEVDRRGWRASNLFKVYGNYNCVATQTWKSEFTLDEIPEGSYLCIAVNGEHGREGAWAGLKVDGEYVGCPDRATSFTSNTWEHQNAKSGRNYTYYVPLTPDMAGKRIEAYVIGLNPQAHFVSDLRPEEHHADTEVRTLIPEVWLTNRNIFADSLPLDIPKN